MNKNPLKERKTLLKNLLSVLVKEWGYEEVNGSLSELAHAHPAPEQDAVRPGEDVRVSGKHKAVRTPYSKPTATEFVNRMAAPEVRKSLLRRLALQFDEKSFLPSISDVRHFLELRGHDVRGIKQRQDAFKRILKLVDGMTEDELERFVKISLHAGPTQLGPLSNAIRATGAAVRPTETPDVTDHIGADLIGDDGAVEPSPAPTQNDTNEDRKKN